MVNFTSSFQAIEDDFISSGISFIRPGFYDDPAFIEVEKANPSYLDNYARFVQERSRSQEYNSHVRKVLPIVAREYLNQLRTNGRLGACIDISGLISRALEREGIWNTVVKGSLTITFPLLSQIKPKYFWSVDQGSFSAGHAWIAAPPYFVVDVSIHLQPYTGAEASHLPDLVCDETGASSKGSIEDLISPEVRQLLKMQGIPRSRYLETARKDAESFLRIFPARVIRYKGTTLKYVPYATTAPDVPFEEMRAIQFEGKSGFDVYNTIVRSALESAQDA